MIIKIYERVHRRLSIILAGTILGLSFFLIFVADFLSSSQHLILAGKKSSHENTDCRLISLLLLGRAISGLGVGLGVPATAIYVAEVICKKILNQINVGYESRFQVQS